MLQHTDYATYSDALDIWCLGATLFTMYMGHSPFRQGREDHLISYEILKQRILNENIQCNSKRWQKATPELKNLIQGCLEKDVKKRFTLEQILQHPWFELALKQKTQIMAAAAEAYEEECRLNEENDNVDLTTTNAFSTECVEIEDVIEDVETVEEEQEENVIEDLEMVVDLRRKSLQSEGDVTSGLGQSKSSDENSLLAMETDELPENNQITEEIKPLSEVVVVVANKRDNSFNENTSDLDEFEGFDENMPNIENWLLDIKKLIIFDKVRQFAGLKPLNRSTNVARKQSVATRRSARNIASIEGRITKPLVANNSNSNKYRLSLIKTEQTAEEKPTSPSTPSIPSAISENNSSQCVENVLTLKEFYGFDDQERKKLAAKAKTSFRMFCTMLRNTQVSLKYFNFERRVNKRSIDETVEETRSNKKSPKKQITTASSLPLPLAPPPTNITLASRKQPSRLARAQRARYVFE